MKASQPKAPPGLATDSSLRLVRRDRTGVCALWRSRTCPCRSLTAPVSVPVGANHHWPSSMSRADQQILALLPDTINHEPLANFAGSPQQKLFFPCFQETCRKSTRSQPRLARRSQRSSASRCSNFNPTQHPYTFSENCNADQRPEQRTRHQDHEDRERRPRPDRPGLFRRTSRPTT